MNKYKKIYDGLSYNTLPTTHIANSLAAIAGVKPISGADEDIFDFVVWAKKAEKFILYNPSGVGEWLLNYATEQKQKLEELAPCKLSLVTSYPTCAPAAFASLYCGISADKHKIKNKYDIVNNETLFDVFAREGKKCALVAPKNSALSLMFSTKSVDIFATRYDTDALNKAITLIKENNYDLIVVHNQEYNDILHTSQPCSKSCMKALDNHISGFKLLCDAAEVYWQSSTLVGFCPDHGAHSGLLGGGSDSNKPCDMNVAFYFAQINADKQ